MLRIRSSLSFLVATLLLTVFATTPPGMAEENNEKLYKIAFTNGEGFAPRSQPKHDSEKAIYGTVPEETEVIIECEVEGETVNNGFSSSNVWARMYDGLYIPNSFIRTGVDGRTPGVPTCSDADAEFDHNLEETSKSLFRELEDWSKNYDGEKAAKWAVANYDKQEFKKFKNNCAFYASNALWQGGLSKSDIWTDSWVQDYGKSQSDGKWVYRLVRHHTLATRTMRLADDLHKYLEKMPDVEKFEVSDWSNNSLDGKTKIGDIISYDWDGDGEIDHVAMVTKLTNEGYPEVTEINDSGKARPNRFWSWQFTANKWTKESNPKAQAYVLHIGR